MQLKLTSEDLLNAIRDYVKKNVTVAEGKEVTVNFKAGRNGNGTTAMVDISDAPTETSVVTTTAPAEQPAEEQIDLEEAIEEASTGEADEVDTTEVEPTSSETSSDTEEVEKAPASTTEPTSIFGNK